MIPKLLSGLRHGRAKVLVTDVPWKYVVRSDKGLGRSAEQHYETMTLEEIQALPIQDYVADDSHLAFWITGPFLVQGAHLPIMRAWGYEPSSMAFVWVKPNRRDYVNGNFFFDESLFKVGMGHTTRQNAEFVILGRRGNPKRISKAIRQVIVEPAREHSRKPEKFYSSVERYAEGPYLELFARSPRKGWTTRGDQVQLFPQNTGAKIRR